MSRTRKIRGPRPAKSKSNRPARPTLRPASGFPGPAVAKRYGVSVRTLDRWLLHHDFPRPLVVNHRRYFSVAEIKGGKSKLLNGTPSQGDRSCLKNNTGITRKKEGTDEMKHYTERIFKNGQKKRGLGAPNATSPNETSIRFAAHSSDSPSPQGGLNPGTRFGAWSIVRATGPRRSLCACQCSAIREISNESLLDGSARGCGCRRRRRRAQGLSLSGDMRRALGGGRDRERAPRSTGGR